MDCGPLDLPRSDRRGDLEGRPEAAGENPAGKSLFTAPPGKGLPIGNHTSQFFANVYLNELDQLVKHHLRARQLHRYLSRQLEATPPNRPLPCILTVVLLQSGQWRRSPTLSSEYEQPEPAEKILAPYVLDFRMLMVKLSELDEANLRGTEAGRLGLALLKTIGEGEPVRWLQFRSVLRGVCSHLPPDVSDRELRRAAYYLASVTDPEKEPEVRKALLSATAEFEPVKEIAMTLLEHLEKRGEKLGEKVGQREGRLATLLRLLSAAFPEFTDADVASVRGLADATLDEMTDALARRRPWKEIRNLLRNKRARSSPSRR